MSRLSIEKRIICPVPVDIEVTLAVMKRVPAFTVTKIRFLPSLNVSSGISSGSSSGSGGGLSNKLALANSGGGGLSGSSGYRSSGRSWLLRPMVAVAVGGRG